ncbi:MAG: energy transducer TonB [Terriglobales bacterium]
MKSEINTRPCMLKHWIALGIVIASCLNGGLAQTAADTGADKVYKVGDGVSPPVPVYSPNPKYSKQARHAKYQGICVLWLVVGADGHPYDIKVSRTLRYGLDEKAIEAVRKWRFKPATKNGKPVAVEVSVEVNFHLY